MLLILSVKCHLVDDNHIADNLIIRLDILFLALP